MTAPPKTSYAALGLPMTQTVSEHLFEQFCRDINVTYCRLPTGSERTPDYDLSIGNHRIVAEVKQLECNDADVARQKTLAATGSTSCAAEPGKRIRQVITAAKKQIQSRAKGKYPGILVIYNTVSGGKIYIDPFCILVGMYGRLQVVLDIGTSPSTEPRVVGSRFGPGKRVTPEHNTSLSAVCVLIEDPSNVLTLTFYHNDFAAIPFAPDWLRHDRVKHYGIRDAASQQFREWESL